jgi:hypothetical protein
LGRYFRLPNPSPCWAVRGLNPAARNGVSYCRDGRTKSALETANRHRDQKSRNEKGEIARKNGLISIQDSLLGLELGTHHPVIEPISASRRERDFRPQRQRRKCRLFAGGDYNGDWPGYKKPLFRRENATRANRVRALETAWSRDPIIKNRVLLTHNR